MRTGGVDPSRMWRKKRSPKPKPKKAKHPTTLPAPSQAMLDTLEDRVPAKEILHEAEEPAGENKDTEATSGEFKEDEVPKREEVSREGEGVENGVDEPRELAEEVDRVNEQVNNCIQYY